jgi:hypothetical protein
MNKTKVTVMIRVPNDAAADYSAAEVHFATIREISKQDANLLVLDNSGKNQVNIHKSFGHEKYKELFKPREKTFRNGSVQVSVAHYILSENSTFNKALLIPFLKKHNVYVFFNQKDGLEHFSAIGVLFGPHPEIAWRQSIVDRLERTIKADIMTSGDCQKLISVNNQPNVVISVVPQQISNPAHNQTKSIALEVRVPAEHEATYIDILDRLTERAVTTQEDEVDIVMDESVGTFFPYYAKRSKPELFDLLMRKQNFGLSATSAIPIFGYTHNVRQYEIEHNGMEMPVESIIWNHANIMAIEPTASSATLGKYIVLVDREFKEDVEMFIDTIFEKIPELEGQPEHFKKPQRGGNSHKKKRIHNISNYIKKLEDSVTVDQMLTDDDSEYSASPPTRSRRPTISYAQATKRLTFQNETILNKTNNQEGNTTPMTAITTLSTLTQESLNETLQKFRQETERSINELRNEMKNEVQSMEQNIAATVIAAIQNIQPIQMEVEQRSENESVDTNTHDTETTMRTIIDRFDALTQMVQSLAQKINEVAESQENNATKRSRPVESPMRHSTQETENQNKESQSPPTKQQRSKAATPPSTPPPNGYLNNDGSREAA